MKNRIFYFAVVPGLFIQLIGAYFYFVLFKDESFAQALYFATKTLIVLWPLLWIFSIRGEFPKMFGGSLKRSVKWGLITGISILILIAVTYFLFNDFFLQYSANFRAKAEDLNVLEHYLLFSFFLSVMHSFIEEYYWRWFILNGLMRKMGHVAAALIGSLAFSSHHFIVLSQIFSLGLTVVGTFFVFGAGVLWSWIYLKSGNLFGSWISHFCADVGIMAAGYFLMF